MQQNVAYSNDNGRSFTKFSGNPILGPDRDPKVFWYAPTKSWVMALYNENYVAIYNSKDLKKWDLELKYKSKPFKYEIKTDVYIIPGKWFKPQGWDREIWIDGKDTGNIFIEFHSRGVDSGITTVLFFTSNEADRFL